MIGMSDNLELEKLRIQIYNELNSINIYGLRVFSSDDFIRIEGNFKPIDNVYSKVVKGELLLNKDEAENFLRSLMQMKTICYNTTQKDVSLVVSDTGRIVFAKDGKELSSSDLDNYYRKLEMESIKSPLDLSLGLIKLRRIYETYLDIYEQVVSRMEFLKGFNSKLDGVSNRMDLIEEAKKKSCTWLRVTKLGELEDVTLYDKSLDLNRILTNGIKVNFSYSSVPLEHRSSYLRNLIVSEYKINLLIEKFTEELNRLKKIDESLLEIIRDIASKNVLSLKEIDNIPDYNILSIDDLLNSVNLTADQERNIANKVLDGTKREEVKDRSWLEDIDKQQRSLSYEEKKSLMIYKSFAYYVINQIVSYIRENNIDLNTIEYDENVNKILLKGYDDYVNSLDNNAGIRRSNNDALTIVDDLFPGNHAVSFDRYKTIILSSINPLLSSLSKVNLSNDMIVYRCVYLPVGQNIINNNLGDALLSTTISNSVVSNFLAQRKGDIKFSYNKVIYKIELPAGSKVIAFTDDIFLKNGSRKTSFGDAQKEILLDSNNFDFEVSDVKTYPETSGEYINIVSVRAVPKKVLSEDENKFSM